MNGANPNAFPGLPAGPTLAQMFGNGPSSSLESRTSYLQGLFNMMGPSLFEAFKGTSQASPSQQMYAPLQGGYIHTNPTMSYATQIISERALSALFSVVSNITLSMGAAGAILTQILFENNNFDNTADFVPGGVSGYKKIVRKIKAQRFAIGAQMEHTALMSVDGAILNEGLLRVCNIAYVSLCVRVIAGALLSSVKQTMSEVDLTRNEVSFDDFVEKAAAFPFALIKAENGVANFNDLVAWCKQVRGAEGAYINTLLISELDINRFPRLMTMTSSIIPQAMGKGVSPKRALQNFSSQIPMRIVALPLTTSRSGKQVNLLQDTISWLSSILCYAPEFHGSAKDFASRDVEIYHWDACAYHKLDTNVLWANTCLDLVEKKFVTEDRKGNGPAGSQKYSYLLLFPHAWTGSKWVAVANKALVFGSTPINTNTSTNTFTNLWSFQQIVYLLAYLESPNLAFEVPIQFPEKRVQGGTIGFVKAAHLARANNNINRLDDRLGILVIRIPDPNDTQLPPPSKHIPLTGQYSSDASGSDSNALTWGDADSHRKMYELFGSMLNTLPVNNPNANLISEVTFVAYSVHRYYTAAGGDGTRYYSTDNKCPYGGSMYTNRDKDFKGTERGIVVAPVAIANTSK